MDWSDFVGWLCGAILVIMGAFFVFAIGFIIYDGTVLQPRLCEKWSTTYDSGDVHVFLDAIDADWHDFDSSSTLRKTYENVRDGKESLGEIKKKKNTTTYVPVVIPVR